MKKGKITKADFIDKYPKSITAQRSKGLRDHTEWDAYDMVLEYLFSTEQVTTLEEANYVMMEMDQQTVGEIVTEVKQELQELLPLAGLALGGLAVNALRKRGKAKRQGKGGSPFKPAGTAAGRAANVPMKKGGGAAGKAAGAAIDAMTGGAVGKAAGSLAKSVGGSVGKAAGSIASGMSGGAAGKIGAMGAAGAKRKPKPQAGTGRTSPRPPHGRRPGGGSIGGAEKKPKVDLTGKSKAQIMALKRLGKI